MEEKLNIDLSGILSDYEDPFTDKEIKDGNAELSYFNLVTENIRVNNRKMVKNSFGMLVCFLVYFLIDGNKTDGTIEILFFKLKDKEIILSFIPICFSFLFFQNVTIFSNNKSLNLLFDKLSVNLFKLGEFSYTKDVIKPFFFSKEIEVNQLKNHKVKSHHKLPLKISIIIAYIIFPLSFIIYSVYRIFIDNYMEITPVVSVMLIFTFLFSTSVQLGGAENKHKEYKKMLEKEK